MRFERADEKYIRYLEHPRSLIRNTALVALESNRPAAVLEYKMKSMLEAEIVNFKIFYECSETETLRGFLDELMYWHPYIKKIECSFEQSVSDDVFLECGFLRDGKLVLYTKSNVDIFKVSINAIVPEQLTVDEVKLKKVNTWLSAPEEVIVCCVKIDNKIVSIDGHSRLVAAYNKGFKYVYAFYDPTADDIKFFKTCLKWCRDAGIFSIQDLAKRVVTHEEHEWLWVSRCQKYFEEHK